MNSKKLSLLIGLMFISVFSSFAFAADGGIMSYIGSIPPVITVVFLIIIAILLFKKDTFVDHPALLKVIFLFILILSVYVGLTVYEEAAASSPGAAPNIWAWNNWKTVQSELGTLQNWILYFLPTVALIFLMFYGVLHEVLNFSGFTKKIWFAEVRTWMAFFLAVIIIPSKWFVVIFRAFISGGVAFTSMALYAMLFFCMVCWGYLNLYVKGRRYISQGKFSQDYVNDLDKERENISKELANAEQDLMRLKKEKIQNLAAFAATMASGHNAKNKVAKAKDQQEAITKQELYIEGLKRERNKTNEDMMKQFSGQ